MKQRLGVIVGVLAAFLVGSFAISGTATAASDAGASATNLEKQVKKANAKAKSTCKKVKKAKGKKAKAQAKKRCKSAQKNAKKLRQKLVYTNAQYFDVCKHGCKYNTIRKGVYAAGAWQFKNKKRKATVRIQPGKYVEGVYIHGQQPNHKFDNLTIMGVTKNKTSNPNAKAVILEGENAQTIVKDTPGWQPGDAPTKPANNAIEARDVDGVVMKNMWARHYLANTFFVWASTNPSFNESCRDYTMDNLVTSDTRSYGFFARNCFGGLIKDSEGWGHGDSALYIGETPCDSETWTNHGTNPAPCQANPDWTVIDNVKSYKNVLGYSGTNSKYVEIKNSYFFNNGAGIVPNTLDSEKFEPSGWMKIHDTDVFWNNYNYFSTGSEFQTVSDGLGELLGSTVNYPMGVGIALFGTDGIEVYDNNIFGNEKWGTMAFSAPVNEALDINANDGDDAKNLNNSFTNNKMGRNGLDPNGIDMLDDNTGGGSCYSGNTGSPAVTYVLGTGAVPQADIYPACPQTKVLNDDVVSFDFTAGIQANLGDLGDVNTILGYVAADPPRDQECSWDIATPHPAFSDRDGKPFLEERADPVVCPTK